MEFDLEHKDKLARLSSAAHLLRGKWVDKSEIVNLLQAVIHSGDRVCLEGNNQKQAQFLARSLAQLDSTQINNL